MCALAAPQRSTLNQTRADVHGMYDYVHDEMLCNFGQMYDCATEYNQTLPHGEYFAHVHSTHWKEMDALQFEPDESQCAWYV